MPDLVDMQSDVLLVLIPCMLKFITMLLKTIAVPVGGLENHLSVNGICMLDCLLQSVSTLTSTSIIDSGVGNGEAPGAGAHPCSSMSKFK